MRSRSWLLLLCGALSLGAPAAAQAPPLERRPGWWLLKIRTDAGGAGAPEQVAHMCTDAVLDHVQTPFGVHMGPGCPPVRTSRSGNGWNVAASCKVGGMTLSTEGRLAGDLASAYHVDLVTHLDPPPTPQTAQVRIGIDARWEGTCPAGKKPGDVDVSMNLNAAPGVTPPPR